MRRTGIVVAGLAALLLGAWILSPFCVSDPLADLAVRTPVRTWFDCRGDVLWYERTFDGEWRFPIRLEALPESVRTFMLNVEDSRFFEHGGIDYPSLARAFVQDLCAGRILSGASTISMQVAGLAHPKVGRFSWLSRLAWKFLQIARARKMERLHSKREILETYFNFLPYGGKIVGVRSAAEYYFGLDVADLTVAEASVLVGIPQSPNRLRPDRHPEAARRRQRLVLDSQVRKGRLTQAESDKLFQSAHLRYRDFALPTPWEEKGTPGAWGFLTNHMAVASSPVTNMTLSVNRSLCASVDRILRHRLGRGVRDAAAVVIEVAGESLRGYVGTMDFASAAAGQVDAARAVRSAGSTLKPFIYLEALEGGLITPTTPLLDAPIRIAGYTPGNFDGTFHGEVTATEALAQSLNTPVIRLLAALGEARVAEAFDRVGLVGSVHTNGLSLALGSAGYRLVDIARAYCRLARASGVTTNAANESILRLSSMLRTRPLANAEELDLAWKTGTSNNLRDAWCFAYTPDWVVGVWYGNKDGHASERLVGAEIAAPAAGEIMSLLYQHQPPPHWGACEDSPATPSALVRPKTGKEGDRTTIISPAPKAYRLAPGETSVTLDLTCSETNAYWYWNGKGMGTASKQAFPLGHHRVVAIPADTTKSERAVEFSVIR